MTIGLFPPLSYCHTFSFAISMFSFEWFVLKCFEPTMDYSECSVGQDWRPCSDTTPQAKSWASADHSTNRNTRWWLTCLTLRHCTWPFLCPFSVTHNEVLYDLWAPPWLLIHLCQHLQHIYSISGGEKKMSVLLTIGIKTVHYSVWCGT